MINPWKYLRQNNNNNIEIPPLKPQIEITPIQLDQNGNEIANPNIQPERRVTLGDRAKNKVANLSQRVGDLLLGQQMAPTDNINLGDGTINVTISNNPRKGGLLRDFAGGFRENLTTPASLENFGQNTLDDGRRKGFGYRLGEGLGSLARFGESPLGRGLITAGIVGATGGSGLEALAYGGTASSLNQQLRNNDRLYRNDLINTQQNALRNSDDFNQLSEAEQAQVLQDLQNDANYLSLTDEEKKGLKNEELEQALKDKQARILSDAQNSYLSNRQAQQLRDIENNINNMRGYITPDTYNNFIRSQQLRENADWRKLYYDDQKAERKLTREIAQQEREYQHQQDAIKNQLQRESLVQQAADRAATRALTMRGQDLNYATSVANLEARNNNIDKKVQADLRTNEQAIANIDRIIKMIDDNPNAIGYLKGSMAQGPKFIQGQLNNMSNDDEIALRSALTDLASMTLVTRTGTAQTAHEIKLLMPYLAQITDNASVAKAKLKEMKNKINLETKLYKQNIGLNNNQNDNPLGLNLN